MDRKNKKKKQNIQHRELVICKHKKRQAMCVIKGETKLVADVIRDRERNRTYLFSYFDKAQTAYRDKRNTVYE